jgi:hypothetical protein
MNERSERLKKLKYYEFVSIRSFRDLSLLMTRVRIDDGEKPM